MNLPIVVAQRLADTPEVWGVLVVLVLMTLLAFVVLLVKQYKRCPPNRVLVVYGRTSEDEPKFIHGGATFVVPLVQDYAYLTLDPIRIELSLRGASSSENISVELPTVFIVAVGTAPEQMRNAAVRLLGQSTDQIKQHAELIVLDVLRE